MSLTQTQEIDGLFNPIEDIELFLLGTDWLCERLNQNEIAVVIKGNFCEYNLTIHWNEYQKILHFAISFHVGLSKDALSSNNELSLLRLLGLLNETMAVGHYDLWREENSIVWRYGQIFSKDESNSEYFSRILRLAIETCEQHYSAFQFVLWAGQSPHEALHNVLFETVGEA